MLGHSAGEMAATYIAGALSLEDAVDVTFHRSRLQHRTAGQGDDAGGGDFPRGGGALGRAPPARDLDRGHQRPRFGHALWRCRGARRDRQGPERRGCVQPALQVDVPFHSPKMEQLEAELVECLRDIRPRAASTPFFSTVHRHCSAGTEMDAAYWYRNIRQPVLFYDTIGRSSRPGHTAIPGDRRASDPATRHRECLNAKGWQARARCNALLVAAGRSRASSAAGIARPTLHAWCRDRLAKACIPAGRDGDQAAVLSVPAGHSLAGVGANAPDPLGRIGSSAAGQPARGRRSRRGTWTDTDGLQLSDGPPARRLDRLSGRGICRDGAGGGARDRSGQAPCVLEDIEFQKFLILDEDAALLGAGRARSRQRASSRSMSAPLRPRRQPGTARAWMRAAVRRPGADAVDIPRNSRPLSRRSRPGGIFTSA